MQISPVIESVLSEKRTQYRNKMNINIISDLGPNSYGLFSKINKAELKRVLSNLINNSVEAFETGGEVKINLSKK